MPVSEVVVPLSGSTSWPIVAPTLVSMISPAAASAQRIVPKNRPMIPPAAASLSSIFAQSIALRLAGANCGWSASATRPKVTMMLLRTVVGITSFEKIGTNTKAKAKRVAAIPTVSSWSSQGIAANSGTAMLCGPASITVRRSPVRRISRRHS